MKNLIASTLFVIATLGAGVANAVPVGGNIFQSSDIVVGSSVNYFETLGLNDTAEGTFTALENLLVGPIDLSVTGDSVDDVNLFLFGVTFPATNTFSNGSVDAGGASASASISGFEMLAGQSFTIFSSRNAGGSSTGFVDLTATFSTFAIPDPAVVPLPAGLPLLLGGLGVLAVLRRKRHVG